MKLLVVISVFVVASVAEPPPSNSYLPPSSAGYPQGPQGFGPQGFSPQVIAARSLEPQGHNHKGHDSKQGSGFGRANGEHGSHGHVGVAANGFGRNAAGHGAQGRFSTTSQGYDHNANAFGRNALDEASEPANYNFGYMVNDYQEGTDFGHHEERQEERAQGEYHVVLPDGRKQTVSYEADERGFKPHITYEDADVDAAGRNGGYDSNANNVRSGDHHGASDHHDNGFANGGGHHGGSNHGSGFNGGNANARSNGY